MEVAAVGGKGRRGGADQRGPKQRCQKIAQLQRRLRRAVCGRSYGIGLAVSLAPRHTQREYTALLTGVSLGLLSCAWLVSPLAVRRASGGHPVGIRWVPKGYPEGIPLAPVGTFGQHYGIFTETEPGIDSTGSPAIQVELHSPVSPFPSAVPRPRTMPPVGRGEPGSLFLLQTSYSPAINLRGLLAFSVVWGVHPMSIRHGWLRLDH